MFASGWGLHRGRGEGRDQAMGGDPAKAGNLVKGLKSNVQLVGTPPPLHPGPHDLPKALRLVHSPVSQG